VVHLEDVSVIGNLAKNVFDVTFRILKYSNGFVIAYFKPSIKIILSLLITTL
jgi:hypothetical protein